MLTSRFFVNDDEKINNMDGFEIPSEWWSRPYEYLWVSKFLNKDDVIIDAGCGTNHPFKDYASKRVSKCFAIDINPEINSFTNSGTLEHVYLGLTELDQKFKPDSIDKIFCISVLEHMYQQSIIDTLKQFKKVLKPDGKIILTIDHPMLGTDTFINLVDEVGLMFDGNVDFEIKKDVIKGNYANLKCYRAVLCKPIESKIECEEIKPFQPSETKPLKPKKTK